MTEARLARHADSNPLGGLTEGRKIRLHFETEAELDRLAHSVGMTFSEYVRTVLMAHVHGADHVRRMHEQRLAAVLGTGSESTGENLGSGA